MIGFDPGDFAALRQRSASLQARIAVARGRVVAPSRFLAADRHDDWEPRHSGGAWNADEYGFTPDDWREMRWESHRDMLIQRWNALRTLWGPPVVDRLSTSRRRDGATDYTANRDGDWTLWRAVRATVGIVLGLYWHDEVERRHRARHGFTAGLDLAFWDAASIYGGYTVDCLWLYPGCRVSIFNDGETNL